MGDRQAGPEEPTEGELPRRWSAARLRALVDVFAGVNARVAAADAGPQAADLPPALVPEIDVSAFVDVDAGESQKEAVVTQVLAACESLGFMNIVGHGVPQATVDSFTGLLSTFMELPAEEKRACMAPAGHVADARGYVPFKGENVNAALGRRGPADLKEAMGFGPPLNPEDYGENIYPESLPGFREAVEAYYSEMERVETILLDVFTRALATSTGRQLNPGHLREACGKAKGLLRFNYYRSCEPSGPEDVRFAAHTDWGPFTILLALEPGLEVCVQGDDGRSHWRRVPVVRGAFTVNVADLLHRWSNGRFSSCIHRVNARVGSDQPRMSVAYFCTESLPVRADSDDPMVECVCAEGEAPRFPPLSIRQYFEREFSSLQSAL